jgi:hypothetical protein
MASSGASIAPAAGTESGDARRALAREVTKGLFVVGVAGSSVGGAAGVVALATRLLGR